MLKAKMLFRMRVLLPVVLVVRSRSSRCRRVLFMRMFVVPSSCRDPSRPRIVIVGIDVVHHVAVDGGPRRIAEGVDAAMSLRTPSQVMVC